MQLTRLQPRRRSAAFDLTPMIDVVLQLIIFFMFTSQMQDLVRTPVDLPRQAGDPSAALMADQVVIDVGPSGEYSIDREPMELDALLQAVQAQVRIGGGDATKVRLLVRADRRCTASAINALADRLAAVGVRHWRLGTASEGGAP